MTSPESNNGGDGTAFGVETGSSISPARWLAIQQVLDGALDLVPESRATYVTTACGTDAALREQVAALLHACARAQRADDLLATPAAAFAAPILADLTLHEAARRTTLASTLGTALTGRYVIERELGHGGMATVFLARDLRHDRTVAVKVLARDLVAPSGVERFLQEIRITARLSHPHVLPVHDSGEADGLLYYVMPHIEGETLRERLTREGAPPLPESIRLLRELSDALAYAHAHGVVHRDLKPENVLLSGGHAVVADFGVAKALAAAAASEAPPNAAESAGVVLGTPAYMAPEQAVGNAATDHRADLYALGVVGYELLAGVHPFGARSPQALVTAHLTEAPAPLGDLRRGVPLALTALVMQCLVKDPAGRPPSAEAVRAALDEVPRETIASRRSYIRRATWAGIAMGGIATLALGWIAIGPGRSLLSKGLLTAREPLVIADFSVTGPDSGTGPMLGRMFGRYLGESRVISILPESEVASALRRMRRPEGSPLDVALAREIAQREGLRAVVEGKLAPLGAGYLVTVRLVTSATGDELASFHATADGPDAVIPVLDKLGRKLRGRIGESLRDVRAGPPLHKLTTSSLEALRKYSEGRLPRDLTSRLGLFREAIALDSTFAYAYFTLGNMLMTIRHSTAARDSAVARAYQLRDRLTAMERTAVTASYWKYVAYDRTQAMATYEAQVARDSTDYRSILNLGLLLIQVREFGRAESLTRRFQGAVDWRGWSNIAPAALGQGKIAAADSATRTLHNVHPEGTVWLRTSTAVALANLRFDSAASLAAQWRAVPVESPVEPLEFMASLARIRGRLAEANRLTEEADSISIGAGMKPAMLPSSLDLVREDLLLRSEPVRAVTRLNALFAAHPVKTLGAVEGKTYAIESAGLYAMAGRTDQARAFLTAVVEASDSLTLRAVYPERMKALGEIALAAGRPLEAMDRFRQSDLGADGLHFSSCAVCILPRLARAAERAGWADSARIFWERYVSTPSLRRTETDQWFLAMAYRKLADLYAEAGNRGRAMQYEGKFTALWNHADPELQPLVTAVHRRSQFP
jgi:serine/threonine-protein kinase